MNTIQKLNTNQNIGLSESDILKRQKEYGLNKITVVKKNTAIKIFLSQFTSLIILILFACALVFLFIGDILEFILVLVIVFVNGFIGFLQEYKADKAVDSLKKMLVLKVMVLRDKETKEIDSEQLVPGDIVFVNEGDKVPADLKILENYSLITDESILTGESVTIEKNLENNNLLFSGTTVVGGRGKAIVVNTGMNTEFGKIINLISEDKQEKTNLEKDIDLLSKVLVYLMIVSTIIIVILGMLRGQSFITISLIAVSIAISAIPEGLPIVMTLTLANGVQIMSKKNAIVKKLNSIEALGSITMICSDKTGTLTLNEMSVSMLHTLTYERSFSSTGYLYDKYEQVNDSDAKKLIDIANNCNNAKINPILGDPTEISLKVLSKKTKIENNYKFVDEIPFSSKKQTMSTIHEINGNLELFNKGAVSEVLVRSTKILDKGKVRKITKKDKEYFQNLENDYASKALRVLGFSYKVINNSDDKQEEDLIFVGIVGMFDPPRPDVKESLNIAKKAGITTKIITGDNPLTAKAIAEKVGFSNPVVIKASDLDSLTDKEAIKVIYNTDIFARAKPEHKFRIVSLLQEAGEIVAVTGDGVNDAPALKKANVGIAMGHKGTEASKEVSSIVLKDDNYSTIISAVAEGRRMYDNILIFVKYMLAVNFDLILFVSLLAVFNFPLPVLALQILWINLVTDSLPAIALGRKKASKDIMLRSPKQNKKKIYNSFFIFIIVALIVKIIGEFLIFSYGLKIDVLLGINTLNLATPSYARTLLVTSIVFFELIFAFACNSDGSLSFKRLFSNKFLNYSILITFILQLFFIYNSFMQKAFAIVPLSLKDWGLVFMFGLSSFLIIPINNFLLKKLDKRKNST